ncbi:hypothetical protein ACIBKZ_07320 [Streptomyces sp. NPDC050421]|uniref:hypothetical protein n=1 Tax=unclassified Streptomyces TaxID=2593676 RepID=UPI0037B20655
MRGGRTLGVFLPLVLLAAGCGIRATDVVEAGEPAIVQVPTGQWGTVLYFVSSSSAARLMPVVRYSDSLGEAGGPGSGGEKHQAEAAKALDLLFSGPTGAERAAGLRSELPDERFKMGVQMNAQGVHVTLYTRVTGLSESARQQLFCTAALAGTADRSEAVTVTGTDGVIGPAHCSV